MDSVSKILVDPKNLPVVDIAETFESLIVPIDLLRAEGQIGFQISFNQPPQGILFRVVDRNFHFISEIRNFDLILQRNDEVISIGISQLIQTSLNLYFVINWSPSHLRLVCGNPGGTLYDSGEQSTQFTIPPVSLIDWATKKSLTPVTCYESEEKLRERIYSSLLTLKDKFMTTRAINGFWDITYDGSKIVSRSPKRETDIHPTIHALLHDQMLLGGVKVVPESQTGVGDLDFSFMASVQDIGISEICVEFKLAHSKDVIHGLEKQLPSCMSNKRSSYGAYCVLWFKCDWFSDPNDRDLSDLEAELISKVPNTGFPGIRVFIFDLGKQVMASRRSATSTQSKLAQHDIDIVDTDDDSPEDITEIQAARADYEAGDYITFDEYRKQRSEQSA